MENVNERGVLISLTAEIAAAHLSNNTVSLNDVPSLIAGIYGALSGIASPVVVEPEVLKPAVSIRSSVKPDTITCLECGQGLKMIRRHLMAEHSMTTDEYRARWGLGPEYPMVAPNYAEQRRDLAKRIGLGTRHIGRGRR